MLTAVATIIVILAGAGVAIGKSTSSHQDNSPISLPATQSPPVAPLTTPSAAPASPPVPTSPGTTSAGSPLAEQLAATFTRAIAQHTVHSIARDSSPKIGSAVFDDYDGVRVGDQHISIYGGHVEVRVIGSTTYFNGDKAGLTKYMGFSDQEVQVLHGQWLTLVAGQAGYQSVTEGVTIASTLDEDKMAGPLRRLPDKTLDGQQVFGISGHGTGGDSPAKGQATMWISTTTGLPVEFDGSSGKSQLTETFTDWGKPIHVQTPADVFGQPGLSS
jgi:hypothetical protein